MAEIKDCIGKNVKISKGSITIKAEDGKTSGVVRNITSLYDLQANKQIEYHAKMKKLDVRWKDISIKNIIIKDNEMYVFRNIKSKLWHEKYGFISEEEKQKYYGNGAKYPTIYNANKDKIKNPNLIYVGQVFTIP